MIDICIVTTLRPEILRETLDSFFHIVKRRTNLRLIVNIDCVPNYNIKDMKSMLIEIAFYVGNFGVRTIFNHCSKGNFARAVKIVWGKTIADYVFNLEDDWTFLKEIDLEKCIERMEKENFDYMRFPKVNAQHLNCLHKVALQPSLWKGDVVRNLAKHMTIDKDPEKQLRTGQGNEELDKILIELQNKGLKDYCSEWCCKDIGREWREERGLVKWNKNKGSKDITWSTDE